MNDYVMGAIVCGVAVAPVVFFLLRGFSKLPPTVTPKPWPRLTGYDHAAGVKLYGKRNLPGDHDAWEKWLRENGDALFDAARPNVEVDR